MKTIIIHHVQEIWNDGLINYGTSFTEQIRCIYEHLSESNYDRVIVTNFEASRDLDKGQYSLKEFNPEVYDYGYGWEEIEVQSWPDMVKDVNYCDGGSHSEVVLIDDWMRTLEGEVYLCGAFDGECIEDMEIALNYVGKEFERLESLIV